MQNGIVDESWGVSLAAEPASQHLEKGPQENEAGSGLVNSPAKQVATQETSKQQPDRTRLPSVQHSSAAAHKQSLGSTSNAEQQRHARRTSPGMATHREQRPASDAGSSSQLQGQGGRRNVQRRGQRRGQASTEQAHTGHGLQ